MSYEKQTWAKGDVVTSAKLNHMEDGIASGGEVFVANVTFDEDALTFTLDKTWQEIYDAKVAFIVYDDGYGYQYCNRVVKASEDSGVYNIECDHMPYISGSSTEFETDSANGYPVLTDK